MFENAKKEKRAVFIPFSVVGYPDMETSYTAIDTLVKAGADALELGIPFSDPVADGPTIAAAVTQAIKNGATPEKCFETILKIRTAHPDIPIGVLTYANAIMHKGENIFFKQVQQAGIDSVLAADIPVFESEEYVENAKKYNVCPVFIAPPNALEKNLKKIAELTKGYTYVVARKGVTGSDKQVTTLFNSTVAKLLKLNAPPSVVGFGISTPEHILNVIKAGASGAISGSYVISIIQNTYKDKKLMVNSLVTFVQKMKAATLYEN
jgi:tryptophan synthase alpha chain